MFMKILVFKTNVQHPDTAGLILLELSTLQGVQRCNFDLQDCDRILRIEASNIPPHLITQQLHCAGYYCEELMD